MIENPENDDISSEPPEQDGDVDKEEEGLAGKEGKEPTKQSVDEDDEGHDEGYVGKPREEEEVFERELEPEPVVTHDTRPSYHDRRRGPPTARELLTDELYSRAMSGNQRLRSYLTGSILVEVNGRERYLFDWRTEELKLGEVKTDATGQPAYDCLIKIGSDNLLKVASGELNPQIGMLSEKIKVEGKLSLAIYFFNLVAPRGMN